MPGWTPGVDTVDGPPTAARRAVTDSHVRSVVSETRVWRRDPTVLADGGQPRESDHADRLFDRLPDPAVLVDCGHDEPRVVRLNEAFARTFGYDADAVVGEPVRALLGPSADVATIEQVGAGAGSCELSRETAEGNRRDYLFRSVPVGADRWYGVYTDITDRTAHAATLSALHETTRELMAAETAATVFDIGVRTARDILGHEVAAVYRYDEDEAALVPAVTTAGTEALLDSVPTFHRGNGIIWRAFETGEPIRWDTVDEAPDVFDTATPVRSALLFPLGERGVLFVAATESAAFGERDRSLGQRLAADVRAALDRVEREQALRERERELARRNERLDEFAAIVSHDLRTPLDLAGAHLELAAEGDDDHLDDIAAAHERMSDLIGDVLAWAREGDIVESTEAVSLSALATECWADRAVEGATLDVVSERTVEADPDRLRQLLDNLFDNAVAHAGPDVTITVGDLPDGGFYVADDGPGVPADERESVFEFGQSLAPGTTGFGLAIVGRIVESHGWSIRLVDSDDGGARFEIRC